MRLTLGLMLALGSAAFLPLACGDSSSDSGFQDGTRSDDQTGTSGGIIGGSSGSSGSHAGSAQDVDAASLRIEPANAVIDVLGGQKASKAYKVFAKLKGTANEIDITSRSVFYVPDNYLVGGFPREDAS